MSVELEANKKFAETAGSTTSRKTAAERTSLYPNARTPDETVDTSGSGNGSDGPLPEDNPDQEKRGLKNSLRRNFRAFRQTFVSTLARRIFLSNVAALLVLLGTILYMNQFRQGLIDAETESLLTQGRIISSAIASSATATPDTITIDPDKLWELKTGESLQPRIQPQDAFNYPINPEQIAPVLRQIIKPAKIRARIYDPDGIIILDSRNLYQEGQVLQFELPTLQQDEKPSSAERIGNFLNKLLQGRNYPLYRELDGTGEQYEEVKTALTGAAKHIVKQTEKGELTVSVAVPIQRFRAVLGVLLLSTEGDGIDRILREERVAILRIFLVATCVILVLSVLLANTIATPMRKLSEAAIRVKRGVKSRVEIPDFSDRQDEVGNLSTSIGEMTNSLYQRIEAIESFAADVSHELKNPLTSLRSAVETLPLAKTEESRKRLMDVIQHDVQRLDRLITDISDASRLDADLARDDSGFVELDTLLENIVAAAREIRRNKHVELTLTVGSTGQGYSVAGHDIRLGQVINNLIDNAVSFVPKEGGKVSIGLTRNQGTVIMVIEDNGPGIQAENLDRVFERFYTDRAEQDGFGQNSGLGLSITRQIVEAHGGKIRAENRRDGSSGARFIVTLPAHNQAAPRTRKSRQS